MNTDFYKFNKILFADDDQDDRELFQDTLAVANPSAELITFTDGDKLIKYLVPLAENPDIIFLDINMPFKDGKTCLKEIREMEKLKEVPVIMFSTSSNPEDIEETFIKGANLYVAKPVSYQDQIKVLQQIFSLNRHEELLKPNKRRFFMNALAYVIM